VHHLTYARVGKERLLDLLALCSVCHEGHHGVFDREVGDLATAALVFLQNSGDESEDNALGIMTDEHQIGWLQR
jgi:hypothetical protein